MIIDARRAEKRRDTDDQEREMTAQEVESVTRVPDTDRIRRAEKDQRPKRYEDDERPDQDRVDMPGGSGGSRRPGARLSGQCDALDRHQSAPLSRNRATAARN